MRIEPAGSMDETPSPQQQTHQDSILSGLGIDQAAMVQQTTAMAGSAANLVQAAGTGFKLDPSAAAALIAGCNQSIDEIDAMQPHLHRVSLASNLGTLQVAQTVAQFTASVATKPEQGYADAVQSYRATLLQMVQAYQKASTNYQETNEQIADAMKKLNPDAPAVSSPSTNNNSSAGDGSTSSDGGPSF